MNNKLENKIYNLVNLNKALKKIPRPIVFTNGVFDILHKAHVIYLAKAKLLGRCLIVGVNSDASVRSLNKGGNKPPRPINTADDRLTVLSGLAAVDLICLFQESTPLALMNIIRPDIYVKGGDYDIEALAETSLVRSWGGQSYAMPYIPTRSTTELLKFLTKC